MAWLLNSFPCPRATHSMRLIAYLLGLTLTLSTSCACFLVGAKQFADCLAAATDPTMSSPQRLIKNCHVVNRNFTEADWIRTLC